MLAVCKPFSMKSKNVLYTPSTKNNFADKVPFFFFFFSRIDLKSYTCGVVEGKKQKKHLKKKSQTLFYEYCFASCSQKLLK